MNYILVIAFLPLFVLSLPLIIELSLLIFSNLFLRKAKSYIPTDPNRKTISRIAILIPAHNEEKVIVRCIDSLMHSDHRGFIREIIVIADNCSDDTANIARKAGAFVIERINPQIRGKGAALDYALTILAPTGYDAYIVVDADSIVKENFLYTMGDNFKQGKDVLQCAYHVLNPEDSPRTSLMNISLLAMNHFKPFGREKLGLSVGILGNGFGFTSQILQNVPYKANSVTEDIEYHMLLISKEVRVHFIDQTFVLSDFPTVDTGAQSQRARWEGGRFFLQRTMGPRMLRQLCSGELRFLEPFLELMSLPLSFESIVILLLFLSSISFFKIYSIYGVTIIFLHIVLSIFFYGNLKDLKAFLFFPGYLIWKICLIPTIIRNSKKNATWVRTGRE